MEQPFARRLHHWFGVPGRSGAIFQTLCLRFFPEVAPRHRFLGWNNSTALWVKSSRSPRDARFAWPETRLIR
jgi:hypothetical protein